ncbi:MAG TPA: SGNH/GDSL hydrolase family protein [Actinomycetota bacterium]
MDPEPFIRGRAFPGNNKVSYPRANPDDPYRLPVDTWAQARIPVGVRLEFVGEAEALEVHYVTRTAELGYRGDGAGREFDLWHEGGRRARVEAQLGEGRARFALSELGAGRFLVYLPEGMQPTILAIEVHGGSIEPASPQPRWVVYGDSVAEGWVASGPAMAWPAVVGREVGLDTLNMGYAGAARGEIVSAEHIAELQADIISISHGTNCWTRTPHSVGMFREGLIGFLDVVRQGHPDTPIVVVSPVTRPDAETTTNRLGATLTDLRAAMESVVLDRIHADPNLRLIPGRDLIDGSMLPDGLHPNDEGHAAIAAAIGPVLAEVVGVARGAA